MHYRAGKCFHPHLLLISVCFQYYYMKSGVREESDCSGVKGKGFVCINPIYSLQLDNESERRFS